MGLEKFAFVAAHDIKSPLGSMSAFSHLLLEEYNDKVDEDGKEMLKAIKWSSDRLKSLVDGILEHSRSYKFSKLTKEVLRLNHFIQETLQLIPSAKDANIVYSVSDVQLEINKIALQQILLNLVSNAIKYNDSDKVEIEIGFSESENHYHFFVSDNGRGISQQSMGKVFDIFTVLSSKDRFGARGNGIGLATVKKLVEVMGGEITVSSQPGTGTRFDFTVAK